MVEDIANRATPKSLLSRLENSPTRSVRIQPPGPQTVDRLLQEIPAIQQMQKAQDETSNPALKTRAARRVFEGLESSEKDDVREFFRKVRQERNCLYDTMGEGQIFPTSHLNPQEAVREARKKQESEMRKLDVLLRLSEATRPPSLAEQIKETVASFKEAPAGTIGSGIKYVTESVLASAAARIPFLGNFLPRSNDHTQ